MSFTHQQVQALLARDDNRCVRCGSARRLTPQHRANRGMGGSKQRDVLSNGLILCWSCNTLLEQDAAAAAEALAAGWKIRGWVQPVEVTAVPAWYPAFGAWQHLWDDGMRSWVEAPGAPYAAPGVRP